MIQQTEAKVWTDSEGLAERYGVARRTIGEWRKHHGLPCVKLSGTKNGAVRFHVETCDKWMLERMEGATK